MTLIVVQSHGRLGIRTILPGLTDRAPLDTLGLYIRIRRFSYTGTLSGPYKLVPGKLLAQLRSPYVVGSENDSMEGEALV